MSQFSRKCILSNADSDLHIGVPIEVACTQTGTIVKCNGKNILGFVN